MNQTTASATASQAASSKSRILNFEPFVNGTAFIGMVVTTPGKKATKLDCFGYFVRKIDAAFGLGFCMKKAGTVPDGEEGEYAINIDLVHGKHSCECKGFLRHGHCKHVEALEALIRAGKLPPLKQHEPKPEAKPASDACPCCGGNINKCGCFDVM